MTLKSQFIEALIAVRDQVASVQQPDGQFRSDTGYTVYGQYAGIYFAFLYTLQSPNNPWFKDADTLKRALSGWDFYRTQINEEGKARICTFDQYWYDSLDEWGCYYWMNTLEMLRPHMEADHVEQWEATLDRIALAIGQNLERVMADEATLKNLAGGSFANHTIWHVLCYYRYGMLRKDRAICDQARAYMEQIMRSVPAHGVWLEHNQLIVKYAEVSLAAVSLFELFDHNARAAQLIDKSLDYVLATTYSDLSANATIDIRNHYSGDRVAYTAPTFARTEAGRAYLTQWIRHFTGAAMPKNRLGRNLQGLAVITDITTFLPDDAAPSEVNLAKYVPERTFWPAHHTAVTRRRGWTVTLAGAPARATASRWCLERQNLLGVFHERTGLLIGGGHSVAQPEFSSFNIVAEGKVHYLHTDSQLSEDGLQLALSYGPRRCRIRVDILNDRELEIEYEVEGLTDVEAAWAQAPLWDAHPEAGSRQWMVSEASPLTWGGAQWTVSKEVAFSYPHHAFNPYLQVQRASTVPAQGLLRARLDRQNPKIKIKARLI